MRFEVKDYDYDGHKVYFELDGKRVFIVQAADEEEGWIEAALINCETGKPHFDYFSEEYVIVRRRGNVRVLIDDPAYAEIDRAYSDPKGVAVEPMWAVAARDKSYPFRFDPAEGEIR